MLECMYIGLPYRRTFQATIMYDEGPTIPHKLKGTSPIPTPEEWLALPLENTEVKFRAILKWVSLLCLKLSNEVKRLLGQSGHRFLPMAVPG